MKKIVSIIILVIALFLPACKTDTVLVPFTATWTQEIPNQEIFGGWEIYMATSEKGTYSLIVKIPFTNVKDIYSYSASVEIAENVNVKRWFKMRAYNKSGEKSEWSNVVFKLIQT